MMLLDGHGVVETVYFPPVVEFGLERPFGYIQCYTIYFVGSGEIN